MKRKEMSNGHRHGLQVMVANNIPLCRRALIHLAVLLVLTAATASATTTRHTPRQRSYYITDPDIGKDNNIDDFWLSVQEGRTLPPKNASVHVLPPSPDEAPQGCDANATLYSVCGAERYCGKLAHPPKNNESSSSFVMMEDNSTTTSYYCLHKTLWDPNLNIRDVLAFLLTGGCCFLSAMAGIGGGGLILPILLLCCNFTPKEASVLSNTAVFCNTLGQFIINNWNIGGTTGENDENGIAQKNTLVYATVLMIMPGLIAGGSVAITLEGLVPSTVILMLAFLTLLLASTKTYHKAQKMRQQEEEAERRHDGMGTPTVSPIRPQHPFLEDENGRGEEDDVLRTAALEWGPMVNGGGIPTTPGEASRKSKAGSELLDPNDIKNSPFFSEPFFGSLGKFMRENPEENCALIIDESSIVQSLDSYDSDDDDSNGGDAPHRSAVSQHIRTHAGCCGRCCTFISNHYLQLLIALFWALDATSFLLLHTGSLIQRCSPEFFVFTALPALFAVVFVGLGRCHLLALRRPLLRHPNNHETVETQPLLAILFSGSSEDSEEGEQVDDRVPDLATTTTLSDTNRMEYRRQNSPAENRSWILWLPLFSAFAGIVTGIRSDATDRRDYPSAQRDGPDLVGPNMSTPMLNESAEVASENNPNNTPFVRQHNYDTENNDESSSSSLQDDCKPLLSWWLPWASVLIGLLAALLGIGGGELLGPILLLLLQMNPQQSSATTAIMSMMNSGTNLLHYIVADMMLAPGYAINLGMMGVLGGAMGRIWATSIAQQGRTSIIAVSLYLVLALATMLVAWELVTTPMSWKSSAGIC